MKKTINIGILLISSLLVIGLHAGVNKDYFTLDAKGTLATRGINLPGTDQTKGESSVTLKLALDVDGMFKIVGIAGSGESFTDAWDTYAGHDDSYRPTLKVRNLFVEKTLAEKYNVQFGSLPVDDGILRSGGFDGAGWIDGLRAKAKTDFGTIRITLASISDLDEANVFKRDQEFNYIEIKMTKKLFNTIILEAAYENFDDAHFAKAGMNYDYEVAPEKFIKLIMEYIYNSEGGYKTVVGMESDVYKLITGKDSKTKIRLSWQHAEDYDFNAKPSSSTFWNKPGNTLVVEASGPISKKWDLSWYTQFRINESVDNSYYIFGIKKGIDFNKLWD